jgi:hypothetical protein
MTQREEVLAHMEAVGPITPIDALNLYGCFRLAARIGELRSRGHQIKTETIPHPLRNGKTYARYSIEQQ